MRGYAGMCIEGRPLLFVPNALLEFSVDFSQILHYNPIENIEILHQIQESER